MENKMKPRKIVLLSLIGFLLIVCIIQAILGARNPVKTLKTDEGFDLITIQKNGETIELALDGSDWYVGKDDFKVNANDMTNIQNNLKEIKVLDTIGRLSSEEFNERYDLNDEKAIVVKASKGGKEIRSIRVGKASSTGSQTYITVGSSKEINLVSGNLNSVFNKSEDSLKSKSVYTITGSNVTAVSVTTTSEAWGANRTTDENGSVAWTFTGAASSSESDSSKVNSWIGQIASLNANSWVSASKTLPSKKEVSVEIDSTEGKITVDVYSEKEDDKTKYYGVSNKTSHKFELSESTAKRFIKNYKDLVK